MLLSDRGNVMIEFVGGRANVSDSLTLVLRSTCHHTTSGESIRKEGNRRTSSTENLEDIENSEIDKHSFPTVVDLRTLDDDGVGGKIDSPGERSSTAENLRRRSSIDGIAVRRTS